MLGFANVNVFSMRLLHKLSFFLTTKEFLKVVLEIAGICSHALIC